MVKIAALFALLSLSASQILASPALRFDKPDETISRREELRQKTITETETVTETTTETAKPQTITKCATGASGSQPATSKPSSNPQKSTSTARRPADTGEPAYDGTGYVVPGAGTFQNKQVFTFENGMPSALEATNYLVKDTDAKTTGDDGGLIYDHQFVPENVFIDDGLLNLKVSGVSRKKQKKGLVIKCGEITTTELNIKYGSIRTVAAFSSVKGTCHGKDALHFKALY